MATRDELLAVVTARYRSSGREEVAIPRNLFGDILLMIADLRPPPFKSTA